MNLRQIDHIHELEYLNQIGFLDDEEFWNYLTLKGIRLATIVC